MEIIPRPAQKLPLWQNILFYLSLALLITSVLSFFLLDRSLRNSKSSLRNLEETLAREKTPQESSLEKDILTWQKTVRSFSQLFPHHLYPSKALDFLGSVSHPEAWIKNVSLDAKGAKIVATGETESFTTLGQQLSILEKNSRIEGLTLASLSIGKTGKVDFILNISLDPEILK